MTLLGNERQGIAVYGPRMTKNAPFNKLWCVVNYMYVAPSNCAATVHILVYCTQQQYNCHQFGNLGYSVIADKHSAVPVAILATV